ncbi:SGNH/GDSL hydrolase family protein [Nocardioides psychrotolerans]|uniref:SGNH/GDSL hydrolase family protein n=1 Tax=Nocardioides psychrotolerans TaxID=1005945 RepID=UPI001160ABCC|nr:SGNH/GDSL hydrolase family protein [Nocardioides psychrotolerans]
MIHRGATSVRARLLTTAVCLFVAASLLTLWLSDASSAGVDGCARFEQVAAARLTADVGSGERVVVVGDSYSVGLGLDLAADSWPSRLPGRVHVSGFSGSGFSDRSSGCGRVSFADRAARAVRDGADLVVVEGGLNDVDRTDAEIRAGFARLMGVLGDLPVLVVGPADAPARSSAVPHVDDLLAGLAEQHGASYLSMMGLDLPYLDDRLHLTPAGHQEFGDAVADAVAALG